MKNTFLKFAVPVAATGMLLVSSSFAFAAPPPPAYETLFGKVIKVGSTYIAVTRQDNLTMAINVSSNTVITDGTQSIPLASIPVGRWVQASGRTIGPAVMYADQVVLMSSGYVPPPLP